METHIKLQVTNVKDTPIDTWDDDDDNNNNNDNKNNRRKGKGVNWIQLTHSRV